MPQNPTHLACEILFAHIRPEAVWNGRACGWITSPRGDKAPAAFIDATHQHQALSHHNQEEKIHLFKRAALEAAMPLHPAAAMEDLKGIFRLLIHGVKDCLYDGPKEPLVRYEKLLAWRALSSEIGQDLPVCAFLAWQDAMAGRERTNFTWPVHLKCDNQALRHRLGRGMAENHYHLWGSVPSFHLTWLRLMGSMQQHGQVLRSPKGERLHGEHSLRENEPHVPLESLSRVAAMIRIYLFLKMEDAASTWKEELGHLQKWLKQLMDADGRSLEAWHAEADTIIAVAKERLGMAFEQGIVGDYALFHRPGYGNLNDGILLAGERMFLYRAYKKMLKGIWKDEEAWLFYLYILIKAKVRREYVQLNQRVGFCNFKAFQDRKQHFSEGFKDAYSTFLNTWTTRFALSRPLAEMPIVSLEARIAPKNSVAAYSKSIRETVETATRSLGELIHILPEKEPMLPSAQGNPSKKERTPEKDRFYFVVHFLKQNDALGKAEQHADHRKKLGKQAHALKEFRRIDPQWAQYIKGIDAASAEIGCRPEVFAHVFRYLRKDFELESDIPLENAIPKTPPLRVTYHVGEDFLDIIDGLRAIDEAMRFLEYRRGDRLGHALALGVDAEPWFRSKGGSVLLPLQDLVDNLAWMHCRLTEIGDARFLALQNRLEQAWQVYFRQLVHASNTHGLLHASVSIAMYLKAWDLRGDDPRRFRDPALSPSLQDPTGATTDAWSRAGMRENETSLQETRESPDCRMLMHVYHYSEEWKRKGQETVHYEVDADYIAATTCLQKMMQQRVQKMGIAVEANPSSNYLIGTFRRYDQHPIPQLYNLGLTSDHQALQDCPQLSVSINTDDLGIFDTSLENEFALMAIALEKMKNADGSPRYNPAMIVDWLERIREAGIGQSFMEVSRNI